jgi:hypothetical protein
MSLSLPFRTKSVQLGGWHVTMQTPLAQSPPCPQSWPTAQSGHALPPQSASVSVPFWTASVHEAAWHTLLTQ